MSLPRWVPGVLGAASVFSLGYATYRAFKKDDPSLLRIIGLLIGVGTVLSHFYSSDIESDETEAYVPMRRVIPDDMSMGDPVKPNVTVGRLTKPRPSDTETSNYDGVKWNRSYWAKYLARKKDGTRRYQDRYPDGHFYLHLLNLIGCHDGSIKFRKLLDHPDGLLRVSEECVGKETFSVDDIHRLWTDLLVRELILLGKQIPEHIRIEGTVRDIQFKPGRLEFLGDIGDQVISIGSLYDDLFQRISGLGDDILLEASGDLVPYMCDANMRLIDALVRTKTHLTGHDNYSGPAYYRSSGDEYSSVPGNIFQSFSQACQLLVGETGSVGYILDGVG
ncbi:MAG: hypothetical protein GF368_03000 [Candidatus Aenigmarchaeota archaeon]|nr:hypothetical protein [Candidatus Aenigmarchaeota archaeon]